MKRTEERIPFVYKGKDSDAQRAAVAAKIPEKERGQYMLIITEKEKSLVNSLLNGLFPKEKLAAFGQLNGLSPEVMAEILAETSSAICGLLALTGRIKAAIFAKYGINAEPAVTKNDVTTKDF